MLDSKRDKELKEN
jgi:hypothetical protein